MTFSIVARCADKGQFGVAIASSFPAVAARCVFARASMGAVATQNVTNPAMGPLMLNILSEGASAETAVKHSIQADQHPEYRQLLAIDRRGNTAIHSGAKALGVWAEARGKDCVSGGNLLANAIVPQAVVAQFEAASGSLGSRLIAALQAGLDAGGEAGPVHSAGLLVVDTQSWPYADLRCDWTNGCPVAAIADAWTVYEPQADDYVLRALRPHTAAFWETP